jgi:hypothetical protein
MFVLRTLDRNRLGAVRACVAGLPPSVSRGVLLLVTVESADL